MKKADRNTVTVVGAGEASGVPDLLRLRFNITARGADVGAALDVASERMNQVLDVVRRHDVADRDIATGQIGVDERRGDRGQRLGFQCYQGLVVSTRDVARSGALMRDAAAAAPDALSIDYVSMAIDDPQPLLAQARDAAFADAADKAEQFARLAGRQLGRVLRVTEEDFGFDIHPRAAGKFVAMSAAVPIEAGENQIRAQITVTWQLTD